MGFKFKLMIALAATCFNVAAAQPAACSEDTHCSPGFFCEEQVHICSECLHCEELGREQPRLACVKSVLECGPCLQGLVDSRLDCVPAAAQANDGLPTYIWVIIGLAVVFLIFLVFFSVRIIIKKGNILHSLKICATAVPSQSTATPNTPEIRTEPLPSYKQMGAESSGEPYRAHTGLLDNRPEATVPFRCATAPSAPAVGSEPPPPYYELPELAGGPNRAHPGDYHSEDSLPFLKPAEARRGGAREAAGRQAAQPFDPPAYIRLPNDTTNNESEPGSPFPPPDDETLESTWTPNESINTNTNSNAIGYTVQEPEDEEDGEREEQLDVAAAAPPARTRRASGDAGPPRKALCVREENPERTSSVGEPQPPQQQQDPRAPLTLVIQNVTNVNLLGL